MSGSYNYFPDPWNRVESGRDVSASHHPAHGPPHRSTTIISLLTESFKFADFLSSPGPRLNDPGYTSRIPHSMQSEEYRRPFQTSTHASIRDPADPAGGVVRNTPQPCLDNRLEPTHPFNVPPRPYRPLSPRSLHHMASFDRDDSQLPRMPSSFQPAYHSSETSADNRLLQFPLDAAGRGSRPVYQDTGIRPQPSSSGVYPRDTGYHMSQNRLDYAGRSSPKRGTITVADSAGDERKSKRYRGGRDEFDGSVQYLSKPPRNVPEPRERDLPPLPVHLAGVEQDDILTQVNKRLSQCAFDFVALYRFPIPMEPDKPPVQSAADKGWTEWAYLLKRLATKRRIPSHAIYQSQIKELTTVLDNSLEMRHATKPQPRPPKDDRTVLQFISAGIQVAKILKDAAAMEELDRLYQQTEKVIQERKGSPQSWT